MLHDENVVRVDQARLESGLDRPPKPVVALERQHGRARQRRRQRGASGRRRACSVDELAQGVDVRTVRRLVLADQPPRLGSALAGSNVPVAHDHRRAELQAGHEGEGRQRGLDECSRRASWGERGYQYDRHLAAQLCSG